MDALPFRGRTDVRRKRRRADGRRVVRVKALHRCGYPGSLNGGFPHAHLGAPRHAVERCAELVVTTGHDLHAAALGSFSIHQRRTVS